MKGLAGMRWEAISALAAVAGLIAVFWQLFELRRQQRSTFEDALSREHREIAAHFPVEWLLDAPDAAHDTLELPASAPAKLDAFLRYIDLCNEQVFLRKQRRVSARTWNDWRVEIRDNLQRPPLATLWAYVLDRSSRSYYELAYLAALEATDSKRHLGPAWWCPSGLWAPVARVPRFQRPIQLSGTRQRGAIAVSLLRSTADQSAVKTPDPSSIEARMRLDWPQFIVGRLPMDARGVAERRRALEIPGRSHGYAARRLVTGWPQTLASSPSP